MPNHITNIITIDGVSKERISEILAAIRSDEVEIQQNSIDFNKVIPMPEELKVESSSRSNQALKLYQKYLAESQVITAKKQANSISESEYNDAINSLKESYEKLTEQDPGLLKLGEQLYDNIKKYGVADWYDWSIKNWGSKWNAYGFDDLPFHNGDNQIEFLTAWSSVPHIVKHLSHMFQDAEFNYKWADEDIGCNVGEHTWQNGGLTYENIPQDHSAKAYEMASEIMGIDLAEYGYRYSEKEQTYYYIDEMEPPLMGGFT